MTTESHATAEVQERRSRLIEETFNGLNKDTLEVLDRFYDPEVEFHDPLGPISGLVGLKKYYANMYQNVRSVHFDFTDEIVQGDTHVAVWTMRLKAKKLNKGKEIAVHGNSVIRFNDEDRVVYHRDYFDMGEFIYRRVPVVRWFVKQVDKRLEHKE